MNIPLPFMSADLPPVGLGEFAAYIIHTMFGGEMCSPCEARATRMNQWIQFVGF